MDGLMSLVSATEFAGLKIKEWNIVQFSKLSSLLNEIAKEYKDRDLSWDSFSSVFANASTEGMLNMSQNVLDLIEPFTKRAPQLISVSCNVEAKTLEEMPFTDGLIVVMLIMKTNMEHLNRFFVRISAQQPAAAE